MATTIYSNCATIVTGCFLYSDSGLLTPVVDGKYASLNDCFTVSGGLGEITASQSCATTTTSTSTTTTLAPITTTTTSTTTIAPITTTTTTSTTTTLPPDPASATLNFDSYQGGQFNYSLSDPIYSTNVVITNGNVNGDAEGIDCNTFEDNDGQNGAATIVAGTTVGTAPGTVAMSCSILLYQRSNALIVNGNAVSNGSTLMIGGTFVTVTIDPTCETYAC